MSNPQKTPPIFFILSKGKSGSTLLQILLDAHPNTLVPIESRFFIHLYKKYAHRKTWSHKDLQNFYNDLFLEEKIKYLWEVDREKLQFEILNQPQETDFSTLCKIVYLNYISFFNKKNIQIIGDKNPINSFFLKQLLKVFPEAKFIHLIRDPRATALSHIKVFPERDISFASLMWVEHNKQIEKVKSRYPSRFFSLKYEDLVQNPEYWLQKTTSFLGLEFHSEMLQHHKAVNKDISNTIIHQKPTTKNKLKLKLYNKHFKNLSKPINTKAIDKWKKRFSAEQIKLIEGITIDGMKRYGYVALYNHAERESPNTIQILQHLYQIHKIKLYYTAPLSLRKAYTQIFKDTSKIQDIK